MGKRLGQTERFSIFSQATPRGVSIKDVMRPSWISLQPISQGAFVGTTVVLNGLVFLGSYLSAVYAGLFLAEYFVTAGLVLQVALIYRRELEIR